jgi:hypothetical protein
VLVAAASCGMPVAGIADLMTVLMAMMVVFLMPAAMIVRVPSMSMLVMVAGVLKGPLGVEGPRHVRDQAALPSRHLGQRRIGLDVNRVARQLRMGMAPPELPGKAQETERVLGAHLEKALRRRSHQDEAAVIQLDGIAVVEHRRPVEIEREFEPTVAPDGCRTAATGGMVEPGRISDAILFHGGFADDAGGAEHGRRVPGPDYHEPVFAIELQGSCGAFGPPFCKSSMEMPSGERIKAIWPSRGGRLMVTPASISLRQVA